MNRDDKGKALHHYLSTSPLIFAIRNGATQTSWDRLPEDIQEAYRTVGEELAQDYIYGGKYEFSLSGLAVEQVIYNGLLSYISPVAHMGNNGWCHLLLLRSKHHDTVHEESTGKLAILTQLPGRLLAIQREIEGLATFVMDFFKYSHFNHPIGDVTITPDNTTFVEYQPYCTFTDTTDITAQTDKGKSEISIVHFDWEEAPDVARTWKNYTASNPRWKDTSIAAVNTMIHNL